MQDQSREAVIWGDDGFPEQLERRETVVYGHWNNAVVCDGQAGVEFPRSGARRRLVL